MIGFYTKVTFALFAPLREKRFWQLKRINLITFPQRIKDLTEWNVFKEDLDERISTELGPGDEVELS
jgi:hypothetical protein